MIHEKTLKIRNPKTGAYDYEIRITDKHQINQLAELSRIAQEKWSKKSIAERILILQSFINSPKASISAYNKRGRDRRQTTILSHAF